MHHKKEHEEKHHKKKEHHEHEKHPKMAQKAKIASHTHKKSK